MSVVAFVPKLTHISLEVGFAHNSLPFARVRSSDALASIFIQVAGRCWRRSTSLVLFALCHCLDGLRIARLAERVRVENGRINSRCLVFAIDLSFVLTSDGDINSVHHTLCTVIGCTSDIVAQLTIQRCV